MSGTTLLKDPPAANKDAVGSGKKAFGEVEPSPPTERYAGAGLVSPYVGVTGFMNRQQVTQALSCVPANSNRKLMVGVLISYKTLRGEKNILNEGRYPQRELINAIFIEHPLAFNVIHYTTPDRATLPEPTPGRHVTCSRPYPRHPAQYGLARSGCHQGI